MTLTPAEQSAVILLASNIVPSVSYGLTQSLLAKGAIRHGVRDGCFVVLITAWALRASGYMPEPAVEQKTSWQTTNFNWQTNSSTTASAGGIDDLRRRMQAYFT